MTHDTNSKDAPLKHGRFRRWLFPQRGQWRRTFLRLLVLSLLLVFFRQYLATGYAVSHDWFWRQSNGTPQHCPDDMRRLMHAGTPGEWMIEKFGEEESWSETTDTTLLPRLLVLSHESASPRVRAATVRGLSKFWDPQIPEALRRALTDPAPTVRAAAGQTISELALADLYPQLTQALDRETDPATKDVLARAVIQSQMAAHPATAPAARHVKVAAIQFRSDFADPASNRRRLETLIRTAAASGAKIIVLPETAITGYTSEDFRQVWKLPGKNIEARFAGVDPHSHAETVPGPSTEAFAKLAGELGIYLTVPLVERDPATDHFFNTIVLVGPNGKIVGHYRKLNPWPVAESGWATRGDHGLVTLDTEFDRLGLLVCFDINFEPEHLRALHIDTLLYCIAWVDSEKSRWFHVDLPRIAQNNDFNIIGANWTLARKYDWAGFGQSLIIDRKGQILNHASQDLGEEIVYADLPVPAKTGK